VQSGIATAFPCSPPDGVCFRRIFAVSLAKNERSEGDFARVAADAVLSFSMPALGEQPFDMDSGGFGGATPWPKKSKNGSKASMLLRIKTFFFVFCTGMAVTSSMNML